MASLFLWNVQNTLLWATSFFLPSLRSFFLLFFLASFLSFRFSIPDLLRTYPQSVNNSIFTFHFHKTVWYTQRTPSFSFPALSRLDLSRWNQIIKFSSITWSKLLLIHSRSATFSRMSEFPEIYRWDIIDFPFTSSYNMLPYFFFFLTAFSHRFCCFPLG